MTGLEPDSDAIQQRAHRSAITLCIGSTAATMQSRDMRAALEPADPEQSV